MVGVVSAWLVAGCALSHEAADDFVPPSPCVDDAATVALTPARRTPGACEQLEVSVTHDVTCAFDPATSFSMPTQWRRARFVNTTDRAAFATVETFADSCPREGEACWAEAGGSAPCACGEGVSSAGPGPASGLPSIARWIAPGTELQYLFGGADARFVLRLCDEPGP
jgi:hypothetical protein